MKKWFSALIMAMLCVVFTLGVCGCGNECTSHVDANKDGKCDECGTEMPLPPPQNNKLATPSNVRLDGNVVTWDGVENADYYDVYVNGTFESTVSTPTFTIEKTEKGTYAVTVCAVSIGNRYATSEESEAVNYVVEKTSLEAPQISVTGDTLAWTAIEGATGYDVYADGEKIASVTETSYTLDIADLGLYTITVKATSTNTGYTSESAASNGVTYKVLDKTVYLTVEEQIAYDGIAPQTIAPEAWRLSSENVKAGQVLKAAFYLTTEQATLTDGRANSLQFTPTLLRAGGTQENGGNFSYVNYLSMNDPENRKVLVTYVMQLPGDFAAGDAVQIGLTANAGMAFTVDKMTIAGADYDFGQDTEYVLFHERATYVEAGKLTLSDGEYTKSSFDSYKSILFLNTTENLVITGPSSQVEGYNIVSKDNGQTENFESGQILKIAVYANITNLTKNSDEVAIDFSHTFWKASTNVHYGYAARSVKFSELEEGKFIFIIVAQIPEEYDANDLYMTWRVYNVAEGVTLTVDKVVVSGGDYDFGKINGDYEIALEAESTHAPTTPVDSWTPSTIVLRLRAPQISVTDDVLSWMAIEGATGYDVYADGEKIASVTETSYVLAADYLKKTITVKATSTNTGYTSESAASNGVTYKVLDKTVYLTVEEQIAYDGIAPQTIAPEAWRLSSENVKAGQVLKAAFYLTTEQATLTDGRANSLQFTPTLLRAGGTQENGGNFSYVNYLSMNDPENRKVLVTYVMQLPGDFAAGDAVQIGLTANAGMAFTVDKMTIAGADYDFGQDTEYVLFHERATYVEAGKLTLSDGEYTKSSFDSYKSILFLNTTENLVITGPSSQVEGYNIVSKDNGQTENFESGQILKIAVYANITNLTKNSDEVAIDFSHTFWKASTNVHYGYAARSVKFSELEEGKFIFIIVAQIPEEYDANDLYMTWRVYNVAEGVTLTVDKVVVSGGDYDFGKINGDYEIALEAESTHAPTTPVDSWTPSTKEQV